MNRIDFENKKVTQRRKFYIIGFLAVGLIISLFIIGVARGWFSASGFLANLPGVEKKLQGEDQDRINILLLGMGGDGHDGAYLTDTIILASFKPSTKEVALFSIPRDLIVPIDGGSTWQKINSINAYAKSNGGDSGLATAQAVGKIFNIPINYYALMDFSGFVNVINELGGVDVTVDNTLDDYAYPILGQENNPNYAARFKHLHLDKGLQSMNGELALEYARSRHATGVEGTDFARSKRQQKVIEAVKDKLLNKSNLLNPVVLTQVSSQLSQHVKTNVSILEMIRLWNLFKDTPHTSIKNVSFSDAPDSYLRNAVSQEGAFILLPKSGNFSGMQEAIANVFGTPSKPLLGDSIVVPLDRIERTASSTILGNFSTSTLNLSTSTIEAIAGTSIEIKNGTHIDGLGAQMAKRLRSLGFIIVGVDNAKQENLGLNLIYDLTSAKPEVAAVLKVAANASVVTNLPDWLMATTTVEVSTTTTATSTKTTTTLATTTAATSTKLTTNKPIIPPADFILVLGAQ
ncbi:MAG: LCP family protein [Candidatus Falkowbacteria bacterium]